ncbi:MAG: hydroxylamine oxidase [Candidatus Aminicenantes bacterium]|nr:hydroxylamine oxidase [Candidatus Aminicenantes bacterium]
MKKFVLVLLSLFLLLVFLYGAIRQEKSEKAEVPISEQTQECVDCHQQYTPGIVEDWLDSEHAAETPELALQKTGLEREVSSDSVPENLLKVAVGCYECHSLNPTLHKDNFEHFDYKINVVVSPNDCSTCHALEADEYARSKKAQALGNLQKNPVYHTLVETITKVKKVEDAKIIPLESSHFTKAETCYACHGTRVEVKGQKTLSTDLGEIEVPILSGWPNQGVGRVNPDGSKGACTACHPRHSFSIEIARKPYTCSQCHLEPDLPAWNVYRESKHGNIMQSKPNDVNWESIPWKVGKDFKTPTCATCHNSLLANSEGELIVSRSHDFGARLWVRIFGLIYSHPQPKKGDTSLVKNKDGLPLPTTFTGELASEFLIDDQEQKSRQSKMMKVCQSCHSSSWVAGHFAKFESTLAETDRMVLAATKLLLKAWEKGLADNTNPFDEAIEQMWIRQWLIYANSVRYGSAMVGPDYAAFKNGWWNLTENLQKMKDLIELKTEKQ